MCSKKPSSEYFGMKPNDIIKLWSKTGSRGTTKHNEIEKWISGQVDKCSISKWLTRECNITPQNTFTEILLCSAILEIAGTADLITVDGDDFIVNDIKTSKKMDSKKLAHYSKQILVYSFILREMISDKSKNVIPGQIILIEPSGNISEGVEHEFEKPVCMDIDLSVIPEVKKKLQERKKWVKNK